MAVTPPFNAATTPAAFTPEVVEKFLRVARENSKAALQEMIATHGVAIVHAVDTNGKSAIIHASETSRMANIEVLLQNGAKLDQRDNWGNTALMGAARRGFTSMVGRLLALGAKIDSANENGRTPLMMAAYHEIPDEKTTPQLPKRKLETLQLLLESGANTEVTDRQGKTVEKQAEANKFTDALELIRAEKKKRADLKADYERRMRDALMQMRKGIPGEVVAPVRATFKKHTGRHARLYKPYSGFTRDGVNSGNARKQSMRFRAYH